MAEIVELKLAIHQPVIEPVCASTPGTEISYGMTGRQMAAPHPAETASATCGKRESPISEQ
jgi:hypothetical protein